MYIFIHITLGGSESADTAAVNNSALQWPEGMIHCYYFASWHAVEEASSWVDKAKAAESHGAAAVIFMTDSKTVSVPEAVSKFLSEHDEAQVWHVTGPLRFPCVHECYQLHLANYIG